MVYVIKKCPVCGKKYNVHKNGKITGGCEHVKMGRIRGKKEVLFTADTNELDEMILKEYDKSKK